MSVNKEIKFVADFYSLKTLNTVFLLTELLDFPLTLAVYFSGLFIRISIVMLWFQHCMEDLCKQVEGRWTKLCRLG